MIKNTVKTISDKVDGGVSVEYMIHIFLTTICLAKKLLFL